ncbi:MAG: TIGR02710 family CRISPR-associated CARF protein [Anaerohalosphaeraceae bacterium]
MLTLVMTVGTGRTGRDIAEALVFSIKRHQPQKVILFCSPKTADQTLPFIEEALNSIEVPFQPYTIGNEDNVEFLYNEYLKILRQIAPEEEIAADFTSGTKAMSAALFAAAVTFGVKQVSYITGPRDQTGRVEVSTDVLVLHPAQIYARQNLQRAMLLFNHGEFEAAAHLAEEYTRKVDISEDIQMLARDLVLLAKAYGSWERFCWQSATSELRAAAKDSSELKKMLDVEQIKLSAKFCESVHQNEWSSQRLYDLFANAKRRFKQGRYDDALSRLYRAFEYLLQFRLFTQYNVKTSSVTLEQLEAMNIPEDFIKRLSFSSRRDKEKPSAKLGLYHALELLCRLQDDWAHFLQPLYFKDGDFKKPQGPLAQSLEKRNRSWLAHGTQPAKKEEVQELLKTLETLLMEHILNQEEKQNFPQAVQFIQLPV